MQIGESSPIVGVIVKKDTVAKVLRSINVSSEIAALIQSIIEQKYIHCSLAFTSDEVYDLLCLMNKKEACHLPLQFLNPEDSAITSNEILPAPYTEGYCLLYAPWCVLQDIKNCNEEAVLYWNE